MSSHNITYIKQRTTELYDQLPEDGDSRAARTDIRDELYGMHIDLFRKIAHHTFLDHNRYDYEDKFQEVCLQFLEIWWWFRWPPRYKTEASFSSYFFIRLKERTERSLNELSYSVYRSTLISCQKLLGLNHWTEVKAEMLPAIEGNFELVQLAMRLLNRKYYTNIDDHYDLQAGKQQLSTTMLTSYCEHPSDVKRLLISEMIYRESNLNSKELEELSDIYSIPLHTLKLQLLPARDELYIRLKEASDIDDSFNN